MNANVARAALGIKDPAAGLIDPRRNRFCPIWDVVMLLALAFTAIVTPVEVSIIDEGACVTPLWMCNRVIDILFAVDIVLIFNTAYAEGEREQYVYSRAKIAKKYISSWFFIDLFSILPFFVFNFVLLNPPVQGYLGCNSALGKGDRFDLQIATYGRDDVLDVLGDDAASKQLVRGMSAIKAIKLLRMLKLARIFKASRVVRACTP